MQENKKNLAGIRGWLLFYVIYSIVGVLINPFYIFKMIEALEWNVISVYDIVSYILIEVLLIISLFNLLKKNKKGPLITIITELIVILFKIIDFFLFSNKEIYDVFELMLIIFVGILWILYFRYSKRINTTF